MAPRVPKRLRINGKLESLAAYNKRVKGSLTQTNTDPNLGNIRQKVKAKKDVSTQIRNQVIRYFSDYISEEIPGFGKKTPNAQAFRNYTGLTGDVSPDAEFSITQFEKVTGIKVSQTNVLKSANADDVGFFETKVSGLGTSSGISFTALDLGGSKDPASRGVIESALTKLGKTNLSGKEAYDLIFSDNNLRGKGNQIIKAIEAKFENLLIVNAYDTEKKGRNLQLNFVQSPLRNVNLRDPISFTRYIDLRIRPRTKRVAGSDQRVVTSYRVEAKPTRELQKAWQYKDITKQVLKAHQGAFSSAAKIYIQNRIKQFATTGAPKEKVTELLAFTEALAQEFKEGGFTPIVVKSTIKPPKKLGLKDGTAVLLNDLKEPRQRPQRFISGVQLTQLVQQRLGKTMRKFGAPQAPDLTERTGTFRSSVNIVANYRKGVIMYYYNPIYDSLNRYGYKPSEQVGKATREVVQTLYARAFNIVKG